MQNASTTFNLTGTVKTPVGYFLQTSSLLMEIAMNLNSPAVFSICMHFYQGMILMLTNVFFDYIQTSYDICLVQKLQWRFLVLSKIFQKIVVSPIVQMFVCQVVKKDFNIDNFIAEQDLETLPRLYGDKCNEYSSDVSEESYNEWKLNEFLKSCNDSELNQYFDLVMADVINSYKWFEMVFDNIPAVLCNYNEGLLAKIPLFMLPLHKIKLPPSESVCTLSEAEKLLLSLIKQFPDPPLPPTSPTLFNFTYTVVKLKTLCSQVDHRCEKKSKPKESTVFSSTPRLLNFLEVNT